MKWGKFKRNSGADSASSSSAGQRTTPTVTIVPHLVEQEEDMGDHTSKQAREEAPYTRRWYCQGDAVTKGIIALLLYKELPMSYTKRYT